MDADGQHDPACIDGLLTKMGEGYDMVVGARDWAGQAGVHRGAANAFYNWLASHMTGFEVKDLTSGFRAVRADKFSEFIHLLPNGFSTPPTTPRHFFAAAFNWKSLRLRQGGAVRLKIRGPRLTNTTTNTTYIS